MQITLNELQPVTLEVITEIPEVPIGPGWSVGIRTAQFVARGKAIGGCVITTEGTQDYFSNVALLEQYVGRGQFLGLASYVAAIRAAHSLGREFTTGTQVSYPASRVWGALAMLGVAEQREPFRFLRVENKVPQFSGLFIAPIGSTSRD